MLRIGIVGLDSTAPWPGAPALLPSFSFYEMHESKEIAAPAETIIDAVCATDMNDDRITQALLWVRELPATVRHLLRRDRQRARRAPFGFHSFTPLSRSAQEVSMGLAGRFWRPDGGLVPVRDVDAFTRIDDPSLAKLVLRFAVVEKSGGARLLRTETFIYCGTLRTRLLFTPYWLMIRLASGWIRRRMLASIERQLIFRKA